ncbi:MAG: hypothetical protein HKN50_08100 [Gammaproteobacteria bacterium]|nr:hypothetical protein [Gammaproteobacteria bacterium]
MLAELSRTKLLLLLCGAFFSAPTLAADRAEMIDFFLEFEEVEEYATESIDKLRDELIASDKKITLRNFPEHFGALFEDYRDALIDANREAYAVYSDEEIKQLYDFYRSDFGTWYLQEVEAFGPRVRELMQDASKTLQAGVAERRRNIRK